jgi:hypothetical protein
MKSKRNIIILIASTLVVILALIIFIIIKNNIIDGFVTIDINNDSIKINYKDNKITSITGISIDNVKGLSLIEGLSKVLSNYTDGTIILIGLDKNYSKDIENFLINDYEGIDRHIIKIIYFDNNYLKYKGKISLGKYTLLEKINLLNTEYTNKNITEILEYARNNNLKANDYLYDLDELDGYTSKEDTNIKIGE